MSCRISWHSRALRIAKRPLGVADIGGYARRVVARRAVSKCRDTMQFHRSDYG